MSTNKTPAIIDPEKFDQAMSRLKPMTDDERRRMMEKGFARGNREEPDNLGLDDELSKPE